MNDQGIGMAGGGGLLKLDPLVSIPIEALNAMGAQRFTSGHYGEAEDCFLAALRADESYWGAWSNLGLVYQHTGFEEAAHRCYLKALEFNPDAPQTITNLGFLTQTMGHAEAARRCFERALEVDPNCQDAIYSLSVLDLMEHKFATGWERWKARWKTNPKRAEWRDHGKPKWAGERTGCVAIWPDQGVGDLILFSTLLPEMIRREQDFVMEVDERLLPAYRRSFPRQKFVLRSDAEEAFRECTAEIPLSGLGAIYRPTRQTFWNQPHRLLVPRNAVRPLWTGRKRIAISWRSFLTSRGVRIEALKSGTLAMFGPLAENHDLVDVQYGDVAQERWESEFRCEHDGSIDYRMDLEHVLEVVQSCDAVVTTCNVTAHIGSALGKPTYVMFRGPLAPLFSWQPTAKGRSIWYPGTRIVHGADDWKYLVAQVGKMLNG